MNATTQESPVVANKPQTKRAVKISPQELDRFSYKFYRDYKRLKTAAQTDAAIAPLAELAEKLWLQSGDLARDRKLKIGERKDKGMILFTIFQPIMLGSGEKSYSGGVHEYVRTPNRLGNQYHWNHYFAEEKPMDWEPKGDRYFSSPDTDFRKLMTLEVRS